MNKAIYQPKGSAGEYAKYACNFYVGCSNGCTYCYCRKGLLASQLGGNEPRLKKCFKDELYALEVFEKELKENLPDLQKHGLFFSFTTDPMLPETGSMTLAATYISNKDNIPVKILTKSVNYIEQFLGNIIDLDWSKISFGFTLTGHDELEPGASTNNERIEAMRKLHEAGFKTFASIEPVIDFESSLNMIGKTYGFCDLYKIGLESGKNYNAQILCDFIEDCIDNISTNSKVYFKESVLKKSGAIRSVLPFNCVTSDYNLFQ